MVLSCTSTWSLCECNMIIMLTGLPFLHSKIWIFYLTQCWYTPLCHLNLLHKFLYIKIAKIFNGLFHNIGLTCTYQRKSCSFLTHCDQLNIKSKVAFISQPFLQVSLSTIIFSSHLCKIGCFDVRIRKLITQTN